VALRRAKALVSLCWRAGYSAQTAELAQAILGQIAPNARLPAAQGSGWPLGQDEMSWQLELLSNM
jgi:hypothetical protein